MITWTLTAQLEIEAERTRFRDQRRRLIIEGLIAMCATAFMIGFAAWGVR